MSAPRPCFRAEFREAGASGASWEPIGKLSQRLEKRAQKKRKGRRRPDIRTSRVLSERLAAQWAGYTWAEYLALPGDDCWVDGWRYHDCKAWVYTAYQVHLDLDVVHNNVWD